MIDVNEEIQNILDKIVLINIKISYPTGVASGCDSLLTTQTDAVKVGVQIFDPRLTRPFAKIRQKVRRLCGSLGSQLMNNWALPIDYLEEGKGEIIKLRNEFEEQKEIFLRRIEEETFIWANKHPEIMNEILANRITKEQAEKSFRFGVRMCRIVTPDTLVAPEENHLYEEVRGLGAQVAREIAQDVRDSWVGESSERTTKRVVGLIQRCRKKAYGLAFVHPKVKALVDTIDAVLSEITGSGPIQGDLYLKVTGLLKLLSDERQILGDQRIILPETELETDNDDQEPEPGSNEDEHDASSGEAPKGIGVSRSMRVSWMF